MTDNRRPDKTFPKDNIHHLNSGDIKLEVINLNDVICKEQPWFWPAFIPNHTITLFAGNGGVGKSSLLLYIAAKTSTGESFKCCGFEVALPKGKVIIMSAEDDPEYQLKPKLIAAGADINMINLIKYKTVGVSPKKRLINLQTDLDAIEKYILENNDISLIIIDPVGYFIGDLREDKNSEVIHFLDILKDFAKKHNLSIILNKHLRKKGTNSGSVISASSEIGGSAAWVTSPRITWIISNDHEDTHVKIISNPKNNLTDTNENCLAYRIVETKFDIEGKIFTSNTLQWEAKTYKRNADDALNKEQFEKNKKNKAFDFIYNYLKENGVSLYKNICDAALQDGISDRQMRVAKKLIKKEYRDEIRMTKARFCNGDQLELIE